MTRHGYGGEGPGAALMRRGGRVARVERWRRSRLGAIVASGASLGSFPSLPRKQPLALICYHGSYRPYLIVCVILLYIFFKLQRELTARMTAYLIIIHLLINCVSNCREN